MSNNVLAAFRRNEVDYIIILTPTLPFRLDLAVYAGLGNIFMDCHSEHRHDLSVLAVDRNRNIPCWSVHREHVTSSCCILMLYEYYDAVFNECVIMGHELNTVL